MAWWLPCTCLAACMHGIRVGWYVVYVSVRHLVLVASGRPMARSVHCLYASQHGCGHVLRHSGKVGSVLLSCSPTAWSSNPTTMNRVLLKTACATRCTSATCHAVIRCLMLSVLCCMHAMHTASATYALRATGVCLRHAYGLVDLWIGLSIKYCI